MIHDVSIPAALIAGLVSFLSPCVLPLVPPYLIYLTGATIEHVANAEAASSSRRAVMVSALMFVLGFSTVFVALGASASLVGALIRAWSEQLSIAADHLARKQYTEARAALQTFVARNPLDGREHFLHFGTDRDDIRVAVLLSESFAKRTIFFAQAEVIQLFVHHHSHLCEGERL